MTLPVRSMLPSSISWADSLRDRDAALPLFDKNLAQTVIPFPAAAAAAAAAALGVLEALLENIQGRWFSQRQTVSVAFESGPSEVSMGSVHTVLAQGTNDPYFCDSHTDELKAGVMTRSIKSWDKVGNVPRKFALSSVGVGETECVSSVTVNVVLVHSAPNDVRITLTREGKQSALPRATNMRTTVLLKDFGSTTTPQQFTVSTAPDLGSLAGRPVRADWHLNVEHRDNATGTGFVRDWWLDFTSDNCLHFQGAEAICGFGQGQLYARAATDDDNVFLECPVGSIISEIVWARYGRIEGSCEDVATMRPLTVHNACEASAATVKKRVASACVGHTSCAVRAVDTLYGETEGEPFLCADELVECREDRSLRAERSTRRQARYESREHHAQAHMAPVTYAGTEDHYLKSTMVRHHTEPFFRPRLDTNGSVVVARDLSMECSSEPRVKKALMVQARCKDANAAFKHTDTPAVGKKMVMASVSADLDNDWKDEVVTLFGYEGGPLHASFTWAGANGEPTTAVVRDLAVGGSAVVLGEGGHIEMATGDFDDDGYPELAFGFVDASGGGALRVFMWDLRMESQSGVAKTSMQDLQPCQGCFAESEKLRSLFATAVEVAVPGSPRYPIMLTGAAATAAGVESGSRLDAAGFAYSLAAAKVNAMPSMLAVAWMVDRSTVSWALFRQTSQSSAAMLSDVPHSLVSLRQPHAVAVNLGDYEGSGLAELALGIVDDNEVTLYLYAIDQLTVALNMTLQKTLLIAEAPCPTQDAEIERDVSVSCYVEPINPEFAYRVQPFVWMARSPDGREYLKVAYTAEPGYYPGVSTWWERTYSKPDPAFNLPWWWTTFKRDRTMLTKEMVATPAVPREEGEVVEVAVTVRNKALVDARNVKVALWRGSPDNCLDEACLLDDNALSTLLFHDMANSGYTLQTLRLDPTIGLSPVMASDGSGLTIGYHVTATVLGDTFTRANVLVQLWHGGVGATGRLIGTVLVPRVNGSTTETKRSEVSVFWATRNPALFGKQELHAVILHSGFSTEAANVISHVSRTVSVACYGRVDACGVCGGNNGTCDGCDGVPLSGKAVDACGVCGGNGSTCCIPKPAQAQRHYVRIDHHHNSIDNGGSSSSWSSMVTRASVGDLVVWENLLDREVEIMGGAYDYKGAPAVELSRFTAQPDNSDQLADRGIDTFLALKTWQENAPAGSSAQYVASTIGRVGVGVLRVGIPVGASFIPLAFGVPVPPTAAISAVGPLIREGMSFAQMAQARPRSAGTTTADAASANNETMTNDPTMTTKQRGMRSLMMGSSSPSSGGGAKYSTTLIDAVAAPGRDGRSALAPGAASVPHRFFRPGLYLWHDHRNTAIHGVIVVEPSDIAVDACGVCGGDNSTCIDCLGVPHGAARLDTCGVCSDPTAAGYTPNPPSTAPACVMARRRWTSAASARAAPRAG
ncbi:FGGAP repeat domain containing protein [Acanthamoeba castellanii str. Neff]|uniref:FGGAP repeat domain containing protein n=1 Tax=Acanthamoeba castellanii (strain ATCC 30010 / Neff) TaxID=1257118 RepID=L8GUS2_ACACF|nr:FGGAP repeat domain containing protein [Acanthamoeba castellanii str. Neff]ELR16378.1 FGGAP repeat domain containing protein [Acanthamoeba castellanii str. Neff]